MKILMVMSFILMTLIFSGCGSTGSSSESTSESIMSGNGTLTEPFIVNDVSEIQVSNDTYYLINIADTTCRILLVPEVSLREVASYDNKFAKTLADLRQDANYLIGGADSDRKLLIKISTYQDTTVGLYNSCDGHATKSISNDENQAGLFNLQPMYEDATVYLSTQTEKDILPEKASLNKTVTQ